MDLLLSFLVFALAMAVSLIWGGDYGMLGALAVGLLAFYLTARKRGFARRPLFDMMKKGFLRSLLVVRIFVFIGVLTALWRASGTIAFFVYHGTRLIPPKFFVLSAFLLASLLAYALGTSYGICGTVGVIMVTLAKSGGVAPVIAAGAVFSGAYFGDRTAPASSCANLVATVTETRLYDNIKRMLRTAALPMVLCAGFYAVLSARHPLSAGESSLVESMASTFDLSWITVLPAILMLVLPLCKIEVRKAIAASSGCAFLVSVLLQKLPVLAALRACLFGYQAPAELAELLSGGGLISMLKVAGIVALSGTYSGIFEGTGMLSGVQEGLSRLTDRIGRFAAMALTSLAVGGVFCNQTIGVMMVQQLFGPVYQQNGVSREDLALDIADSLVVLVGMIPWCIACVTPLNMMGVSFGALPYAAFLYLLPLCRLAKAALFSRTKPGKKEKTSA